MWIRRKRAKSPLAGNAAQRRITRSGPLETPWWTGATRLMAMVGTDYNLVRLTNRTPQGKLSPHHAPFL
jgi:hypothetical protein